MQTKKQIVETKMNKIYFLGILLLCLSCASTYKNIDPETLGYSTYSEEDGIRFSYQTNVLQNSGNRKYVKKENRSGVSVLAVKITNNTPESIIFNEDVVLQSGMNTYGLLTPDQISSVIKQNSASYLLFLLLIPMKLTVSNNGETSEYSIGYAVGPGIALGNLAMAAKANSNFNNELMEYSLINKEIRSGETVYGLVGIRDYNFGSLDLKIID